MARIPDTYQEVEYLRGTGTQYIRTSYFATGNTSIKIKFRVNELKGYGIFGSRDTTTPTNAYLMWGAGAGFWRAQYGNQNFVSEIERDTEWHTWEQRKNACFLDGKLFYTFEKQTFQNSYEQLLFGIGSSATTITGLYVAKNDIGVVEYWENTELTMQLIPCYRKADKEAGYYDTIYDEFLTNAGTGKFEVGPDVLYEDEVQEVEYIYGTGTQYIDGGVIGKTGEYKIRTKIRTSDNISGLQSIYGVRKDSGNTRFMLGFYTSSNQIKFDFAINTDNFGQVVSKNTDYEFEADYTTDTRTLKINGVVNITSSDSLDTGGNIYIFGYNRMWQPVSQMTSFFVGRMYEFDIIDKNGKSILSLKPAYRKSDNKTGMYDRKRKVFFPNLGAGEFLLGENVYRKDLRMIYWQGANSQPLPSEYQAVEYVESAGASTDTANTHSIDLGFKGNQDTVMNCTVAMLNSPRRVFGNNTISSKAITLCLASSGSEINRFGTNSVTGAIPSTLKMGEFQNYTVDKNGIYCDGQQIAEYSPVSFETDGNLRFLTIGGYAPNVGVLRVKNFEIVGKVKLQACKRKTDNVAGFYDFVSGEFKTCDGLTAGNDIYYKQQIRFFYTEASTTKLPNEYQEVNYISGTSYNSYMVSDYKASSNTRVVVEARPKGNGGWLFGARSGTGYTDSFSLMFAANATYPQFGNDAQTIERGFIDGAKHTFKLSQDGFFVDDEQITTFMAQTFQSTHNQYLLCMNNNEVKANGFIGDVFSVRYYEGSQLVRDYVPCYRKADNVIGLYDIINGKFCVNVGTVNYEKGPCVHIPSEYQEVEYIESDGNQYINTGYTGNIDTEVNYHGKFLSATGTFFQIFGNNVTSSRALTVNLNITGNAATSRFGNKTASMSYRVPADAEVTLKLNKNVFGYIDNKGYLQASPIDATTSFTTNGTLHLMFVNGDSYKGASQFYESTIVQAGVVARKYKPVYRKADGVIGVYDVITGTFLTNAGTGTFTKGADVKNRTVRFIYV